MKPLFPFIQERLKTEVPELNQIDLNTGQLSGDKLPPLDYPAAIVGFKMPEVSDLDNDTQEGDVFVTVMIIHRVFEKTHSEIDPVHRADGLSHLDINDKTHWAPHGFAGNDFTQLSLRSYDDTERADLRIYALTFDTRLTMRRPNPQYIGWGSANGVGVNPAICLENGNGDELTEI